MEFLVTGTVEVSLLVLAALAVTALLRRASAAARHWVLATALVAASAMPVLERIAPSWPVRNSKVAIVPATPDAAGTRSDVATPLQSLRLPVPDVFRSNANRGVARLVGAIWMTGACLSLFAILVGFARLAWLASRSRRVVHGRWRAAADGIARGAHLRRRVRLLQSDHPTLLVTWGLLRPKVLLPTAARDWTDDRIRIVLAHELAHIRRADWGAQLVAEALRCVYWFNPLVWIACRRLRAESEHACDDAVLDLGVKGHEYATHLVDLARTLSNRSMWVPAPAMARPSSLEGRITAMLNTDLNRSPVSRLRRSAMLAAAFAIALSIAGLGASAQSAFAAFSGSFVDQMNGVLPAVTLVLTNTDSSAKYQVKTDRTGRFQFVGLPSGTYSLEAQLPGFATLRGQVTVNGQDLQQDFTMNVGTLEETVTVRDDPTRNANPPQEKAVARRPNPPCSNVATAATPAIGGNIRAPKKLRHVSPNYPRGVADAKPEELVTLAARIDGDGYVSDVQLLTPANPAFAGAAMDAVRQWEFDSTLLNCMPVEVSMTVRVKFEAAR
jgi:beta-lactamase regulating signal transducer with metallopeptidase domain